MFFRVMPGLRNKVDSLAQEYSIIHEPAQAAKRLESSVATSTRFFF